MRHTFFDLLQISYVNQSPSRFINEFSLLGLPYLCERVSCFWHKNTSNSQMSRVAMCLLSGVLTSLNSDSERNVADPVTTSTKYTCISQ